MGEKQKDMCLIRDAFPELPPDGYEITSRATANYNSVAWSIGEEEMDCCWWPVPYGEDEYHWPAEREHTLVAFENIYLALGYERCETESPEIGFTKGGYLCGQNQQANSCCETII